MARVKVWNDNDYEHKESFKGDMITIAPHSFVEMDYEDAHQFKGQFTGLARLKEVDDGTGGLGEPDPRYFKKIRVEYCPPEKIFRDGSAFINPITGKSCSSQAELNAEIAAYAAANQHLAARNPDLDGRQTVQNGEIDALKRQVAELTALVTSQRQKKGPGRPKKEA